MAQTVIHSKLKARARDEMPRPQATNIVNLELAGQLGEYWLKYRVQSLLRDFAKYTDNNISPKKDTDNNISPKNSES